MKNIPHTFLNGTILSLARSLAAILALAILAPVSARASAPANPDAILGVWLTANRDSKITIKREGDSYVGRISWLKNPNGPDGQPLRDERNPNAALRGRPLMGLQILWNLKSKGNGEYDDGKLYDPTDGKIYSGKAELESDKVLRLRGYVGVSLFGRTEKWIRE